MRTILVDSADAGDVVCRPILNDKGMTLLPKGATLTPALINRLRGWGIREIEIEGDDPNRPPPKSIPELLADLDHRFRGQEGNHLMMQLKSMIREQTLGQPAGVGAQ